MSEKIKYLINGYHQFRKEYFSTDDSLYKDLSEQGQSPRFLIVACSDSRVDPAIVLNCKPGDLFVIRNVANLIPPYEKDTGYHGTSAALEFGICGLQIRHLIVMGHSQCGGIRALMNRNKEEELHSFVSKWMELAEEAKQEALSAAASLPFDEQVDLCSRAAVVHSIENLKSFPWIKERLEMKTLFLHGWHFNIAAGEISVYDPTVKQFKALAAITGE